MSIKLRVGILIACRMKSSRLPRKALLPIVGKPLIDHLIERMKAVQKANEIILCTSTHPDDAILENAAKRNGIHFFCGSEEDVLSRFIAAAKQYQLEVVVRVTGDNPLTDPEYIDRLIESHSKTSADFSKVEQLPLGMNCEVISLSTLKKAHELAADPNLSEYMTAYLKQPKYFKINMLEVEPYLQHPEIRLTIDVQEDLNLMEEIYRRLYQPAGRVFTNHEIIKLLMDEPHLAKINQHVPERALPKILLKDDPVADKPKIVLLGADMDGRAGKVLDIIEKYVLFNVVGLVDEQPLAGHTTFRGIPVLGGLDEFFLKIPPGTEGFFICSNDWKFCQKGEQLLRQHHLKKMSSSFIHPEVNALFEDRQK